MSGETSTMTGLTSKPKQDFFFLRGSSAEEFCYFDGRSGLPTLCISAMKLVALQNNGLIDVLCNSNYLYKMYTKFKD